MRPTRPRTGFTRFAKWTARAAGRPVAFCAAALLIVLWIASGPLFGFSDTWQLVINTGTTIITFLMVFLIQSTQNRDAEAMQVKLDELIRLQKGGHNALLDLEELEEEELDRIRAGYGKLAEDARERLRRGLDDTDVPELKEEVVQVRREVREEKREVEGLKRQS
jgi:low affinity Fe/Cu permease